MTDANPHTTSLDSRRWRRIAGVLALTAMLTLAGCNGILGGGDQQNTTTTNATVTPVDVPTDQPTASPAEQLVPGLTSEGVTNSAALLQAQSAFLENHSTMTRSNTTITAANGSVLTSINQTIRQSESSGAVAFTTNYTGSTSYWGNMTRLEGWSTDDGSYVRATFKNGTISYSRGPASALNGAGGLSPSGLSTYLSTAGQDNTSVVTRQVNGSPRYLVSGNANESAGLNTDYRLTIDEQGVTRDLLAIRPNYGGPGEETRGHVTLETIGNESVGAPEWLSEARQQTQPQTSTILTTTETATSLTTEGTEAEINMMTNKSVETTTTTS